MPYVTLAFNPGINKEQTFNSAEQSWFDCDKIRFRAGLPEKIGGWTKPYFTTFLGTCRGLHPWVALDKEEFLALGTSQKYYILQTGAFNDITPLRDTSTAEEITFAKVANGSSTIEVTHTAHGAVVGDFVTFTGFQGLGGDITADVLNQEYKIDTVPDDDTYRIRAREVEPLNDIVVNGIYTPNIVDATSSDTGDGELSLSVDTTSGSDTGTVADTSSIEVGSLISGNANIPAGTSVLSVDTSTTFTMSEDATATASSVSTTFSGFGEYQLNVGLDDATAGAGWGIGAWGRNAWNFPATVSLIEDQMRIWSQDNFGEDLIINYRDGSIYYWDRTGNNPGDFSRAVELSDLAGATETPTIAKQVMISDKERHVLCFGANPQGSSTQDPLLIRFSDSESVTNWDITDDTGEAGDLLIGSGSEIIRAIETRQEILVFTDTSLHSLKYNGPPFFWGVDAISENISIAGPLAVVAVEDAVFWMGKNEFYVYGGTVQRIPCTVRDYVYSDINNDQIEKVAAGVNAGFGEVWWFYPSADSTTNNRYVIYNYVQQIWYIGTIERTAWIDRGIYPNPVATSSRGDVFFHESGADDQENNTTLSPMDAYIESAPIYLGEGDNFMLIQRIIPDVTFRESDNPSPTIDMVLKMVDYPGNRFGQETDQRVTRTANVPIEKYTDLVNVRLRGRGVVLRAESSDQLRTKWRIGTPKIDVRPDGRK